MRRSIDGDDDSNGSSGESRFSILLLFRRDGIRWGSGGDLLGAPTQERRSEKRAEPALAELVEACAGSGGDPSWALLRRSVGARKEARKAEEGLRS